MTGAQLALVLLRLAGRPIAPGVEEVRARILAATILRAAAAHDIPILVLAALRQHESGGSSGKVGDKGERGAWQVLPATARFLGFMGSDEALAADPLNAHYAAAWLAIGRAACIRAGHPDDPAIWLNKYRGGSCRRSWYARQIMDEVLRVSKPITIAEAIADYYRRIDAPPRPERTRVVIHTNGAQLRANRKD